MECTFARIHLGNPIEIRYKLQQYGVPIELIPSTDTGNIKSVNLKQWMKLRIHLERERQKSAYYLSSSDNDSDNNGGRGGYDSGGVSSSLSTTSSSSSSIVTTATNIDISTIVECPLSNDVIFRRGKTLNFHPGNVKFQNLIESHIIHEHSIDPNTSLIRRKEIVTEVMNEVCNNSKSKTKSKNESESGHSGCGCGGYGVHYGGRFLTWNMEKQWWLVIHSDDDEIQKKIHYAFRDFKKKMLKTQQPTTTENGNTQQQKKRYHYKKSNNNNNNGNELTLSSSSSSSKGNSDDDNNNNNNNNGCNTIIPFLPSIINNNIGACGYFFSTDDSSYTCLR
ncbi:hypothetical protein FRACYDRAFT_249012 [Fragilariopsis cylindrus CCMP1102]|uniref:Uncharacterized protein n=1 Tax=Fragilariopsis cylindrus CCMP1102 TaxID=635003 RepID=A0A1E7ETA5_9STRA|nr:hypothetical protein FRACYDRAFT_249012 [Fragilariopsis cylindrus CCMP1102]|eukprot:OEU09099.1 hypothetical protein FRACYDRAFT_249012 [Fragilariopsis cylindrus CCMP1102]